jgi:hypothetical protein
MTGSYNLIFKVEGFKTVHQNGIAIEADEKARLDFALTIGSKSDSITVLGSAPLLNTSNDSMSVTRPQCPSSSPTVATRLLLNGCIESALSGSPWRQGFFAGALPIPH